MTSKGHYISESGNAITLSDDHEPALAYAQMVLLKTLSIPAYSMSCAFFQQRDLTIALV